MEAAPDRSLKAHTLLNTVSSYNARHARHVQQMDKEDEEKNWKWRAGIQDWVLHLTTVPQPVLEHVWFLSTHSDRNYKWLTSPLILTAPLSPTRHGMKRVNFNLDIPGRGIKR